MRSLPRRALLQLSCLGLLLASPAARAGEKEFTLALHPAFAFAYLEQQRAPGGGGGLDLSYGVTEALAVRVTGAFTAHSFGPTSTTPGGPLYAYHAGAGLTYSFDVLRLVPYIDFSIGLLGTRRPGPSGKDIVSNQFGVQAGIGVDYLINRRLAVGVVVRYHAYLTSLTQIPVYLFVGPRLAIHFGG